MHLGQRSQFPLFFAGALIFAVATANAQSVPTPEQILNAYRPVHRGVEYDTPDAAEFPKCRVELERQPGAAGYVVYDPAGIVLRKFTDTDGDSKADQFRYFRMGLEVYRDIDSNKNEKPDQHRWMNWGGTRWGVDRNEDGKIDQWRFLSAQEAARIAVEAMIANDAAALETVLINAEDIRQIKPAAALATELLKSVSDHGNKLRRILSSSRTLTNRTKWVRFDPPVPGLIPSEEGRAATDLIVYENAMSIVENDGKHELISIGEMVQVGNVWKLTQLPSPLDSENAQIQIGGILMQPQVGSQTSSAAPLMTAEMETLLKDLQTLDESSPNADASNKQLAEYNRARADVIEKIIRIVPSDAERLQWIQQFADGMAAAVQTGEYDAGLTRLSALQDQVKANQELLGYVWYRRLLAEYAVRLKTEDDKERQDAQKWWLGQLEEYASKWPKSRDAADAIVQLAISLELMGRVDDARKWYAQLVKDHSGVSAGIRARGALRRLALTGQKLELSGRSLQGQNLSAAHYQGKVLLVVFWSTWGLPYTADLPTLKDVYARYNRSGFEILGVNLDTNANNVQSFLQKNGGTWQHIRDADGFDGKIARDFGIVSVPTMFLVDKNGIVAGGITAENLEVAVESLLKGRRPETPTRSGAAVNPTPRN